MKKKWQTDIIVKRIHLWKSIDFSAFNSISFTSDNTKFVPFQISGNKVLFLSPSLPSLGYLFLMLSVQLFFFGLFLLLICFCRFKIAYFSTTAANQPFIPVTYTTNGNSWSLNNRYHFTYSIGDKFYLRAVNIFFLLLLILLYYSQSKQVHLVMVAYQVFYVS